MRLSKWKSFWRGNTFLGIKKLGKELQLKRTDSEVVGMVKNCFVRLYDGNNVKEEIYKIYS